MGLDREAASLHEEHFYEWGDKIITSVLAEGLKPASALASAKIDYFGSADDKPEGLICGRVIPSVGYQMPRFRDEIYQYMKKRREESITEGLYGTIDVSTSVLPVVMERYGEDQIDEYDTTNPKNLEERGRASFVVAVAHENRPWDMDDEVSRDAIPPEDFLQLFVPLDVWNRHAKAFTNVAHKTSVITGSTTIQFPVLGRLTVPDYESSLRKFSDKVRKTLWVHGVRLPTIDDLHRKTTHPDF